MLRQFGGQFGDRIDGQRSTPRPASRRRPVEVADRLRLRTRVADRRPVEPRGRGLVTRTLSPSGLSSSTDRDQNAARRVTSRSTMRRSNHSPVGVAALPSAPVGLREDQHAASHPRPVRRPNTSTSRRCRPRRRRRCGAVTLRRSPRRTTSRRRVRPCTVSAPRRGRPNEGTAEQVVDRQRWGRDCSGRPSSSW